MTITIGQHTNLDQAASAGVSTAPLAYPSATGSGSLLVACARIGSTSQTITATDTQGNTWVNDHTNLYREDTGGDAYQLLYALNSKGGANTVTVAWTTANVTARLAIIEFPYVAPVSAFDQHNTGGNSTGTALVTGTVTPTVNNSLVVALQGTSGATTYTQIGSLTFYDGAPNGGPYRVAVAAVVQTAAAAATGNVTLGVSESSIGIIATFKPAAWQPPNLSQYSSSF